MYAVMQKPPEEQQKWFEDLAHSDAALTFQMDKQTNALKAQTEQLSKITDALQPYLEFMRTLNELAALSTLSTEDLNNGLNSIKDTLVNLGSALSTVDLRPVMASLFGTKITSGELEGQFTGGQTTGFMDTMAQYQFPLNDLRVTVSRLSNAINSLVTLANPTKLKEVFEDILEIMANFGAEMGGMDGFAQKFADGMDAMLKSAGPLITYFQDNNAAVELFNSTLLTFKTTITNVVDTMDMLKRMSEMTLPTVDELGAGFDRAKEFVANFDEALLKHLGISTEGYEKGAFEIIDEEAFSSNIITAITQSTSTLTLVNEALGESFDTFKDGADTITELVSTINSLVSAFQTLQDMPLITSEQIVAGFEKIKDTINAVNEGMKSFAKEGLSDLVTYLKSVADMWTDWDAKLGEIDDTFGEAVTDITTLVNAITSLIDVQTRLASLEAPSATDWQSFFETIAENINNINEGMLKFGAEGAQALANDLIAIDAQWALWQSQMGTSLTTFNDASSGITGLTNSVSGLVNAFTSLAEMPVLTADAFSAGMKDMSTNITNFAKALKDNIETIEKTLEAVDDAWSDHAEKMDILVPIFKDATSAINTLAGGILSVVRSFESLKETDFEKEFATGFQNLTKAVSGFANALNNNIDGLLTSLNALVNGWLENEEETVRLMRAFITISSNFMIVIGYANALQSAFEGMTAKTGTLSKGFDELIEFMNGVLEGVQKIYTTDVAADLADFVTDVGLVINALASLGETLEEAMETIRKKTETTVNDTKTKVSELDDISEDAGTWGANLIVSFVDGMKSMEWYLKDELSIIAETIYEWLGVGSNTKLGALSHLTDWPKNLVSTFAEGIRKGVPDITKALSGLRLPMDGLHMPQSYPSLHGGGNKVTFNNIGWNIGSKSDADYVISEMETMLTRRSVL
jgi:uncharacterized phage infection (PIP) family protein YhgE